MSKFNFDKSSEELLEAYHMFDEGCGTDLNYFGANCQLEIGSNYLRQNDAQTSNAFIFKAYEVLKQIFSDDHPLIQKYYSYASEVASHVDNTEMMLQLARQ